VNLVLGEIAGISDSTIQQHWNELCQGTPVEQARLHFRSIKAEAQCMTCFQKYHPLNGKIFCNNCGSVGAKILSGEEFYLESIELDHE
jgi:hydrogenase nickel incorporation protein HypA/HybF